ncbi:MAG: peptidyl-alpha-hydroxyglycine alpha-amidating lyase family protein [Bryobacteraceae bacterium]
MNKPMILLTASLFAATSFAQIFTRPISEKFPYPAGFETPQAAPEIPFDTPDPNYFVLPGDWNFGEVSAIATNSKGHVFILSRSNATGNTYGGSATQVFEFDEKGKFVRELGHALYGFAYGHGIRVDKDDNIWVVDKGTDMAVKFNNKTGKVMMVLGRREELTAQHHYGTGEGAGPANFEEGGFREPTDIAWDSKGNMYISDGYVNSRVAKYDKDGRWMGTWGKRGFGPSEFHIAHNVAVDKNDHVWVADRWNGRLQVFDTNGNFLKEVIINVPTPKVQPLMGHQYPPQPDAKPGSNFAYRPGAPDALCIPPDNPNVMFIGDLYPGRVYKINLDGKVLGYFGHVGKLPGEMGGIHGLACPSENLIYTAEFENWRAQKFVLHPEKMKTSSVTPTAATASK